MVVVWWWCCCHNYYYCYYLFLLQRHSFPEQMQFGLVPHKRTSVDNYDVEEGFTGKTAFLSLNKHCQSTEWNWLQPDNITHLCTGVTRGTQHRMELTPARQHHPLMYRSHSRYAEQNDRDGELHSDEEWSSCVMQHTLYSQHAFHESIVTRHGCEDLLIIERCKTAVRAWTDFISWLHVTGHQELAGYACQSLYHVLSTCSAHSLSCFFSAITSAI